MTEQQMPERGTKAWKIFLANAMAKAPQHRTTAEQKAIELELTR